MPTTPDFNDRATRRARQKRTVTIFGCVLVVGGLVIIFALERLPLPMRILTGLADLFAGLVFLILIRQKFN